MVERDSPMADDSANFEANQNNLISVDRLDDAGPHQQQEDSEEEEDQSTLGPKYVLVDTSTGSEFVAAVYTPLIH